MDLVVTLDTLGPERKKTSFSYEGSVATGVIIRFERSAAVVDAGFFRAGLRQFAGREVRGGFKMDGPPAGGFGEWVQRESGNLNSMRLTARHASFIAAILCHEAGVRRRLEANAVLLTFPDVTA
jgi:hypothetical protein